MRKYMKNIIYAGAMIWVWGYVAHQYLSATGGTEYVSELISGLIFSPQKMFFNHVICFTVLIYINALDCNRTEYVIRCKSKMLINLLYQGLGCAFFYGAIVFLTVSVVGLSCGAGGFGLGVVYEFLLFLVFLLAMYSVFMIGLICFRKRFLSVLPIVIAGFLFVIVWTTCIYYGMNTVWMDYLVNVRSHILCVALSILLVRLILSKKEYLR